MIRLKDLKHIVEESDTRAGRIFDLAVQFLVLVSLVSFSVETLPNLSPVVRKWLNVIEMLTVGLFTAEYLLRVAVATPKRSFILSFFGLIDLSAILPFYLSLGMVDLRVVRIVRFLRFFRILKLTRYYNAITRFRKALSLVKEELILFSVAAIIVLYISAVGIYFFEREAQPEAFSSVFHSLWWAIVTLTSVGYGDVYPVTVGGRVFTAFVLIVGLGIVAVPTGLIASALSRVRQLEDKDTLDKPDVANPHLS